MKTRQKMEVEEGNEPPSLQVSFEQGRGAGNLVDRGSCQQMGLILRCHAASDGDGVGQTSSRTDPITDMTHIFSLREDTFITNMSTHQIL